MTTCKHCGRPIVPHEWGWTHAPAGPLWLAARSCGDRQVAEPKEEAK